MSRGQTPLFGNWRLAGVGHGEGRSGSDEEGVQSEWNLFGNPDNWWRGKRVEVGMQIRRWN